MKLSRIWFALIPLFILSIGAWVCLADTNAVTVTLGGQSYTFALGDFAWLKQVGIVLASLAAGCKFALKLLPAPGQTSGFYYYLVQVVKYAALSTPDKHASPSLPTDNGLTDAGKPITQGKGGVGSDSTVIPIIFLSFMLLAGTVNAQAPMISTNQTTTVTNNQAVTSISASDAIAALLLKVKSSAVINSGYGTDLSGHRGVVFEQQLTLSSFTVKSSEFKYGIGAATLVAKDFNQESLGFSLTFDLFTTPEPVAKLVDAAKPIAPNFHNIKGFLYVGEPVDDWIHFTFDFAKRTTFSAGLGVAF